MKTPLIKRVDCVVAVAAAGLTLTAMPVAEATALLFELTFKAVPVVMFVGVMVTRLPV